jgi:hypothetical protein
VPRDKWKNHSARVAARSQEKTPSLWGEKLELEERSQYFVEKKVSRFLQCTIGASAVEAPQAETRQHP